MQPADVIQFPALAAANSGPSDILPVAGLAGLAAGVAARLRKNR